MMSAKDAGELLRAGAAARREAVADARRECLAEVDVWLRYYRIECNDPNGQGAECAQRIKDAILALDKS